MAHDGSVATSAGNVRAAAAALENGAKRGRAEPVPDGLRVAAEPDYESLIEGLRGEVLEYVDKNLKSTADKLTTTISGIVRAHDAKCEKRFSVIEQS
jgi:hypothetical protein